MEITKKISRLLFQKSKVSDEYMHEAKRVHIFIIYFIAFGVVFCYFAVANFASAASFGETIVFNTESAYDAHNRSQITATLKEIGSKVYFYTEDSWWNSLTSSEQYQANSAITNLSREFDQVIYPKMIATYGSEWNPGIDNDSKITILFTRMVEEAGGYFNFIDEHPKLEYPSSNEREMIYINSLYILDSRLPAFLAHEFQHLITFNQKTKLRNLYEEDWLNEARSEYTPTLLSYDNPYPGSNLEKRVKYFLTRPSDSLTEWRNETGDYGVVNLFMQYLVDHYGENILTYMTQSDRIGIASIEFALQKIGATETFADLFNNWTLANYLNNCSFSPVNRYCYFNPNLNYNNLHVVPTSNYSLGQGSLELATWTKDWSPRWYRIESSNNQAKNLQINFESFGTNSNFQVFYILKDSSTERISSMTLNAGLRGSVLIPNFGSQVKSVVVIPINQYKRNSFTSNDPNTPFSAKFSIVENINNLFTEGILVKSTDNPKVYLIDGGTKRWIASAEIFIARGFSWQDIKVVSPTELDPYPEGKIIGWPDGTLIKSTNYPTVYVISLDKKRPFASAEIFTGLGYQWKNIKTISQLELEQYELGNTINSLLHPDGALIKSSDSPKIYLVEGNKKRWIPSIEIFLSKGYNFNLVMTVSSQTLNNYLDGLPVL